MLYCQGGRNDSSDRHCAEGLVAARPTVLGVEALTGVLVSADIRWDYCDAEGRSRQEDGYRYVLRLTDEGPQIQVVIATPPPQNAANQGR